MITGVVTAVDRVWSGGTLSADVTAAATVLPLDDAGDFDEEFDEPRYLVIGEETTPREYVAVENDEDLPNTVTLAAAVGATYEAGLPVVLWDPEAEAQDKRAVEWSASVRLDDADDDAPAIPATIPHEQIPMAGPYSLVGAQVRLKELETGVSHEVETVVGREPVMSGAYIDPRGLPEPVPLEPPTVSPALHPTGMPNSILLRTDPVAAGTTQLTFQVSADYNPDTGVGTWQDLPGMPTRQTIVVASSLPDGTAFTLDTTYWFRVTASNAAGSAAPSAPVSGARDTAAVAIIARQVIAEEVLTELLVAGTVEVGANIALDPNDAVEITQVDGRRIYLPIAAGAWAEIPLLSVSKAKVSDGLELSGASKLGGTAEMNSTITDPTTAPTVSAFYPSVSLDLPGSAMGLCRSVENDGWVTVSENRLYRLNESGAQIGSMLIGSGTHRGVTRVGTSYYVLYLPENQANWRVVKVGADFGTKTTYTIGADLFGDEPGGIGTDGTNVLVVWTLNNAGWVSQHSPTNMAENGASVDLVGTLPDPISVYKGVADLGTTRYVIHPRLDDVRVYSSNGATRITAEEWPRPHGQQVRGMWWDGSHFWAVNVHGVVRKLSPAASAPAATYWWSYTYVDSDTHATGPSPEKSFARPKRAQMTVTMPGAPQETTAGTHVANRIQPYAATTSGGTKFPQGSALAVGVRSLTVETVATTGTPPGANNWAGVTDPFRLVSQALDAGGFPLVDVNGSGSVGRDTGALLASSPFTGSARFLRFGKMVHLYGAISRATGSSAGFTATGIVVPVGMRPAADTFFEASPIWVNGAPTGQYQIVVRATGSIDIRQTQETTQTMPVSGVYFID